jgi:acetyltransferase-like isoleucine patch superfamily enzyme
MIRFIKRLRILILQHIVWRRYKIGKKFHAGARVRLWAKDKIEIGNYFYIGRDSQIEADCIIGDYVIFGNRVAIVGRYDHNYQQIGLPTRMASQIRDADYSWHGLGQTTIIEDDVWVGYGSIIMSGVRISRGSIIAAGSLVTKDVEPYSIYAGVPAKKIKDRFNSQVELNEHLIKYKAYTQSLNNRSKDIVLQKLTTSIKDFQG